MPYTLQCCVPNGLRVHAHGIAAHVLRICNKVCNRPYHESLGCYHNFYRLEWKEPFKCVNGILCHTAWICHTIMIQRSHPPTMQRTAAQLHFVLLYIERLWKSLHSEVPVGILAVRPPLIRKCWHNDGIFFVNSSNLYTHWAWICATGLFTKKGFFTRPTSL